MILRYEDEVRVLLTDADEARYVRALRVDQGLTWRGVGEAMSSRWSSSVGSGDSQSFGATICHVAAELLNEDPDGELIASRIGRYGAALDVPSNDARPITQDRLPRDHRRAGR
jgi:hypothetical protein